jgi:hypothetical protein
MNDYEYKEALVKAALSGLGFAGGREELRVRSRLCQRNAVTTHFHTLTEEQLRNGKV